MIKMHAISAITGTGFWRGAEVWGYSLPIDNKISNLFLYSASTTLLPFISTLQKQGLPLPNLSMVNLPTTEGWKAEFALQGF